MPVANRSKTHCFKHEEEESGEAAVSAGRNAVTTDGDNDGYVDIITRHSLVCCKQHKVDTICYDCIIYLCICATFCYPRGGFYFNHPYTSYIR